MLAFTTTHESLLIGGKTFPIKENIKALGGVWDSSRSSWTLPASLDSEDLRSELRDHLKSTLTKERKQRALERASQRAWERSPEGIAAAEKAERDRVAWAFKKKQTTGDYFWICCPECKVMDWAKMHTICHPCGEWDGQSLNAYRIRGSIYTGT